MKKILIADDDPSILKLIEHHLSLEGYEITTAEDGFNALEKIQKSQFDLIISDIMMPNLSGLSLLSISKEFQVNVPIIFISSLNKGDIISKSLRLGMDSFMAKPVDLKELSERIKRMIAANFYYRGI